MDSDPILEDLMKQMGDWGTYQLRQHLLHIMASFLAGIHMLSLTFIASTPRFRCFIPEVDNKNDSTALTFNDSIISHYLPNRTDTDIDSCHKYEFPGKNDSELIGCNGSYVFDLSVYKTSRVIQWQLVCNERFWRALLQTFYMFGVLIGGFTLGWCSDKFGRKKIFYVSALLQLVFGLSLAFTDSYAIYAAIIPLYGMFGSAGCYMTGFVLTMELVGTSKRTLCGTAFSASFAVGVMLIALWGYLIEYYKTLQIVLACHSLLLVFHWWLIDESIRWLWGQGKTKEAVAIIEKAVTMNGKRFRRVSLQNIEKEIDQQMPTGDDEVFNEMPGGIPHTIKAEQCRGVIDLFAKPRLRWRTLNVAYAWFANAICYYGLSFGAASLPGNPYIIFFVNGLVELPAYLLCIMLSDKTGRRSLGSSLLGIAGIFCIILAFMKPNVTVTIATIIPKLCVSASFAVFYNYTAELFPTVCRNSAVGIATLFARFGGMVCSVIGLTDELAKFVPGLIFGTVAVTSAYLALYLPETNKKELPHSLHDGENFGRGDTAFSSIGRCCRRRDESETSKGSLKNSDGIENQPLATSLSDLSQTSSLPNTNSEN